MTDFNDNARYEFIKKLNKNDKFDNYYFRCDRGGNAISSLVLISIGIVMGMVLITAIKSCDKEPEPVAAKQSCADCHNHRVALTKYFRDNGSRSPEAMANAVLKTKSPRLMSAIAKVESNGNPQVRNTGYKKRHHGAFQVNPKHWGAVPTTATAQALQAEAIIKELTTDYGIKKALSVYGGDSTSKYQRKILAELVNVP